MGKGWIKLKCLLHGCRVIDPIPKNCLVKYESCPGCRPGGLCPPFFHAYFDGLEDVWNVTLVDSQYNEVPHNVFRTRTGVVVSFQPSKQDYIERQIGLYSFVFEMGRKGKLGHDYIVKSRVEVSDRDYPTEGDIEETDDNH